MNALLTTLQDKYPNTTSYAKRIIAVEYARLGGVYSPDLKWDTDSVLAYMHAKYAASTLTQEDWGFVVHHGAEMQFHGLSNEDIDVLKTMVPPDRVEWFTYMREIAPHYTWSSLSPLEALIYRLEQNKVVASDVDAWRRLSPEEQAQVPHAILDRYLEYWKGRLDFLTPQDNEALSTVFQHPTYPVYFHKKYGKTVQDIRIARHCPLRLKLARQKWSEPLTGLHKDSFLKHPTYVKMCRNKGSVNILREVHFARLTQYAQVTPYEIFSAWLMSNKTALLEPWLWLPIEILPQELQDLRTRLQLELPSAYIMTMGDVYKQVVAWYEEKYKEHIVCDNQWSLYSSRPLSSIRNILNNININDRFKPSNYQITNLMQAMTMPIPEAWISAFWTGPTKEMCITQHECDLHWN